MTTTHTEELTPNFVLAQHTEQVLADLTEDDDDLLTAPHAPHRPQRSLRYAWEPGRERELVCTDRVPVERAVLRVAVTILRREIGEHQVWASETADVYDGYRELELPLQALTCLLRAFAAHRGAVAPDLDTTETSEALDAHTKLDLLFDDLERVQGALSGVLAGYLDPNEDALGNYERAARVAHTITDITEAMAAFERDVLIPREQAGAWPNPVASAKEQEAAREEEQQATKGA